MKVNYYKTKIHYILLMVCAFSIYSCQDSDLVEIEIDEVQYELSDGKAITVLLNPTLKQESRTFASLEEHDAVLDLLEDEQKVITLNKEIYLNLSHYFNPYEISLLDYNYQIEINGVKYKADKEATYEMKDNEWKKIAHYGQNGDVDLKETSLIYDNLDKLHSIESYSFKSPEAQRIYERFATIQKNNGRILAYSGKSIPITYGNLAAGVPTPCDPCNESWLYTFQYYWGVTQRYYNAQALAIVWNEENAQWGTNAKSGTKLQIRDMQSGGRIGLGFQTPEDYVLLENGSGDAYRPYVYTKHVTRKSSGGRTRSHKEAFGNKWSVSVTGGRRNNWKTLSNHYINFRDPSSGINGPIARILTVPRYD